MKIGFIGLGHMGSGMAMRLIKESNYKVSVFNRTQVKAAEHIKAGGKYSSIKEIGGECDVVITMLSDDEAVEEVSKEMAEVLPAGKIHLSMSTISVNLANRLHELHSEKNQRFLGAPVFGRPDVAAEGKLTIMTGGDEKALEECRPILEIMSQKIISLGPSPAHAHLTKILGNFMLLSSIEMLAESLRVAESGGMKQEIFLEAMTSSLFSAPFFKNYGTMMINEAYKTQASFTLKLALKDAGLAVEAASGEIPMGNFMVERLGEALKKGMGDRDLSALKALR